MSVDSSIHFSIPGNITFSSNCPPWAAQETEVSFPIMLKQIIFIHSAKDGFTFPGMIDEPACTAGIPNSASPAIGPDAINLISFAIFPISIAKFRKALDAFTTANLLCNPCCISFSGFNESLEIFPSSDMTIFLYPFGVFAPVPTAVPLVQHFVVLFVMKLLYLLLW